MVHKTKASQMLKYHKRAHEKKVERHAKEYEALVFRHRAELADLEDRCERRFLRDLDMELADAHWAEKGRLEDTHAREVREAKAEWEQLHRGCSPTSAAASREGFLDEGLAPTPGWFPCDASTGVGYTCEVCDDCGEGKHEATACATAEGAFVQRTCQDVGRGYYSPRADNERYACKEGVTFSASATSSSCGLCVSSPAPRHPRSGPRRR